MRSIRLGDLKAEDRYLIEVAAKQRETAHAPYSKFKVGAAVRSTNGKSVYSGANMENASYGLTICAEASALARAVAEGDFSAAVVAVVGGPKEGPPGKPTAPCGRCRQLIFEAAQWKRTNTRVLFANHDLSAIEEATIDELLPGAFGPADLGINA